MLISRKLLGIELYKVHFWRLCFFEVLEAEIQFLDQQFFLQTLPYNWDFVRCYRKYKNKSLKIYHLQNNYFAAVIKSLVFFPHFINTIKAGTEGKNRVFTIYHHQNWVGFRSTPVKFSRHYCKNLSLVKRNVTKIDPGGTLTPPPLFF